MYAMAGHASRRWRRTLGSARTARDGQSLVAAVHRRIARRPVEAASSGRVRRRRIVFMATFASAAQGTVRTSTRLRCMRIIGTRLCLLIAGAALVAGPTFAQTPNPTAPVDSVPREATPGAESTAPAQNLSKKLNQSNGIIHPKEVDPAIRKRRPTCKIRTSSLRQGLRAALPRRSRNKRPSLAQGRAIGDN